MSKSKNSIEEVMEELSFFNGVSSIFGVSISPDSESHFIKKYGFRPSDGLNRDKNTINSYWNSIGDDIRTAAKKVNEELEDKNNLEII